MTKNKREILRLCYKVAKKLGKEGFPFVDAAFCWIGTEDDYLHKDKPFPDSALLKVLRKHGPSYYEENS